MGGEGGKGTKIERWRGLAKALFSDATLESDGGLITPKTSPRSGLLPRFFSARVVKATSRARSRKASLSILPINAAMMTICSFTPSRVQCTSKFPKRRVDSPFTLKFDLAQKRSPVCAPPEWRQPIEPTVERMVRAERTSFP